MNRQIQFIYCFFVLLCLTVDAKAQGTDCSDPLIVNSFSYSASHTTCGFGNNYDANIFGIDNVADFCYPGGNSPGNEERNSYGGEDFVIAFSPPASACHTISITTTTDYAAIHVLRGCPDNANSECVGFDFRSPSGGNNPTVNFGSLAGETYYIVIDNWPSPSCINFNLSITSATTAGIVNDFCADALPLQGSGSNVGANCEPNEWSPDWPDQSPSICTGTNVWQSNENGVWYTFNNPMMQTVNIDVNNISCSGGNNKLQYGVWTNSGSCDLDQETLVGCAIAIGSSSLMLNNLPAGNYYLFADGDAGSGCTWEFDSNLITACTGTPGFISN